MWNRPENFLAISDFQSQGVYLWIWNPQLVPPHIGISIDNQYYSMLFDRVEEQVDVDDKLILASRKKIPLLLIELNINKTEKDLKLHYQKYTGCIQNQSSCLRPILQLSEAPSEDLLLKEFMEYLYDVSLIGKIYSQFLPSDWKEIEKYSMEDVRLNWLKAQKNAGNIATTNSF